MYNWDVSCDAVKFILLKKEGDSMKEKKLLTGVLALFVMAWAQPALSQGDWVSSAENMDAAAVAAVEAYWTTERIANAMPAPMPSPEGIVSDSSLETAVIYQATGESGVSAPLG